MSLEGYFSVKVRDADTSARAVPSIDGKPTVSVLDSFLRSSSSQSSAEEFKPTTSPVLAGATFGSPSSSASAQAAAEVLGLHRQRAISPGPDNDDSTRWLSGAKRSRDDSGIVEAPLSAEEKRMKRVLANRRSAKESRERKKRHLDELEATVVRMTKKHDELARENDALRAQIDALMALNRAGPLPSAVGGIASSLVPPVPASMATTAAPGLQNPALQNQDLALLLLRRQQQQQQQQQSILSTATPTNPSVLPPLLRGGNSMLPSAQAPAALRAVNMSPLSTNAVAAQGQSTTAAAGGNRVLANLLSEAQNLMP